MLNDISEPFNTHVICSYIGVQEKKKERKKEKGEHTLLDRLVDPASWFYDWQGSKGAKIAVRSTGFSLFLSLSFI